jgi:hypothetical protein
MYREALEQGGQAQARGAGCCCEHHSGEDKAHLLAVKRLRMMATEPELPSMGKEGDL